MRYYRTIVASAMALLLFTCTSCDIEELDADGDGLISKSECLSALFDAVCGDQGDTPTDEPPIDEPPTDEPPTDEPPTDETPGDGAGDDPTDGGLGAGSGF
jgi:hypothetical protein